MGARINFLVFEDSQPEPHPTCMTVSVFGIRAGWRKGLMGQLYFIHKPNQYLSSPPHPPSLLMCVHMCAPIFLGKGKKRSSIVFHQSTPYFLDRGSLTEPGAGYFFC